MHSEMFLSVHCTAYRSATNKVSLLLSKKTNKSSFVCPGMCNQNCLHKIVSLSTLFKMLGTFNMPLYIEGIFQNKCHIQTSKCDFQLTVQLLLLAAALWRFWKSFPVWMRDWCCMAWLLSWNDITFQCHQNSYLIIWRTLGQISEEYWKSESTLEEEFVCISIQLMSSFSPHIYKKTR